jgi:hypothetical protein
MSEIVPKSLEDAMKEVFLDGEPSKDHDGVS